MNYRRRDEGTIELTFETGDNVHRCLTAIAEHSYALAVPRGLGHSQPHEQIPESFDGYIQRRGLALSALIMDYVNGRDCRTCITKGLDGKWLFNAYAFEQRGVTAEEFHQGKRKMLGTVFLDEVITKLGSKS